MPTVIHPTAILEKGAQLGADCHVHPYAIVKKGAILGDRVAVHPFAVVGGDSQDLKFDPAVPSGVRIGAGTTIRESVTINRSTVAGSCTEVGSDCLLMACCHVAHDCTVGNRVVIANAVLLAGHVQIGDRTFLGGGAVIHQFVRIGESAMIGGGARISSDVAPFCLATERNTVYGLNMVGLRRRGFERDVLSEIKQAFRETLARGGNLRARAAAELASGRYTSPEARAFLEFLTAGRRTLARVQHDAAADEE